MITQFKIYESKIPLELKDGDCVIMNYSFNPGASLSQKEIFKEFLVNNIGVVKNINKVHNNIAVKYYDIPFQISTFFRSDGVYLFPPSSLSEYASTPEELKIKIQTKKYNL